MSKRILVVEDDKVTARYLELGLKRLGYSEVSVVASSDAALEAVRRELPDLVLMDVQIEGARDGIETAKQLRLEFGLPVIFLTGQADELTIARAKQVEPLGYLVKPVKAVDLQTSITVGLHKNSLEREVRARERIFAAVTAATHEIVVACDGKRNVIYMNPAAERFLGREAADTLSKPVDLLIPSQPADTPEMLLPVGGQEIAVAIEHVGIEGGGEVLVIRPCNESPGGSAELRRLRAEFAAVATEDPVSGLANGRGFLLIGEQQLQFARRVKARLALLFIDVDGLERVQGEFGASAVEQAVRDIADTLRSLSEPGELLGRAAPERFAVLLASEAATKRATDFVAALEAHRVAAGRAFKLDVVANVRLLEMQASTVLAAELERASAGSPKLRRAASAKTAPPRRKPN